MYAKVRQDLLCILGVSSLPLPFAVKFCLQGKQLSIHQLPVEVETALIVYHFPLALLDSLFKVTYPRLGHFTTSMLTILA
jgi:hypothetical protein